MKALLEDAQGNIWIGTRQGLAVFDAKMGVRSAVATELQKTPVFSLIQDTDAVLVGTERGLFRLTDADSPVVTVLAQVPVSALLMEENKTLWIGTVDRGVLRLSNGKLEQLNVQQGLPNNRVISLLQDREKSIWVGTHGGVFRLRDAPFSTLTTEQGLAGNFVRAVLSHSDGCMYVGSSGGLSQHCGTESKIIDISAVSAGQSILSLAEGPDGSIWVGTSADGAIRLQTERVIEHYHAGHSEPGKTLPVNEVRAILPLADGGVWIGTSQGVVKFDAKEKYVLNQNDGLPSAFIMALHQASDGRIFIGTGAGVAVVDSLGDITVLSLAPLDNAEYAFGFAEDPSAGLLWMTTDRGIVAFNLHSDTMHLIGRAQGIPFDKLFQMVIDQQGYLWISSNRGVLRLNRQQALDVIAGQRAQVDVEVFGEGDGMASAQANGSSSKAATLDAEGRVWIATSMGVSWVHPQRLQDFARIIPPVVIEQFLVDRQSLSFKHPQVLSAGTTRVEIHYAGLGFIMPQRILYRTMLEGFDSDWVSRDSATLAEYTNLPPGRYRFRVVAAYPGGDWSQQEATIAFVVQPFLWQQTGFRLLLLALFCGSALLVVQWRLRRLRHNEIRLEKLVREQTAELQLLARQDALTGLPNRRAFDEHLQLAYQRMQRNHKPLALALIDIDHFKRINDRYSHAMGDEVLKRVAQSLKRYSRGVDMLARWGGEEFVLLMSDTPKHAAIEVCRRILQQVAAEDFSDLVPDLSMTVSIGLVASHQLTPTQLLAEADSALYQAKRDGRNRMVVADS